MGAPIELNPGAQKAFVEGKEKYSAYIGGLGSGKTFAGLARGLKYALQPKPKDQLHAPFGVVAAASYPALKDIIIPELQKLMHVTGLADWDRDYAKSDKQLTLINGAVIRLRSLDNPNWMRGPEYTWFFIDEGRNVGLTAWKVLTARLRQRGYKRAGFVASTPNGYDWMYDVFHPDGALHIPKEDGSPGEYADAIWYPAPTFENKHLDEDYLTSLVGGYSGRFYDQEVLGKFVGIVEGGVFPDWDSSQDLVHLEFDPALPLYSFWDFGVGDPGVCIFAQISWEEREVFLPATTVKRKLYFPTLRILKSMEARDWTAKDWAEYYHTTLATDFRGARTRGDYGDPAGTQRAQGSGTSVIEDLNTAGVKLVPVQRRPQDYAIRILGNMMADHRVLVNETGAKRVSDAFSSHKWHLKDGVRIGVNPVHDWTSHFVDAVRYGATALIPFLPREGTAEENESFEPNTWGYVFEELDRARSERGFGRRTSGPQLYAPQIRTR